MDVVEETKPRVEGEMVIMRDDEVVKLLTHTSESQNGPQMVVRGVRETASTGASPQATLKSEAPIIEKALPVVITREETRYVEEFGIVKPASNMRYSKSEIYATEDGVSSNYCVQTKETKVVECSGIERRFTCSEEASVDVHSEDSEKRDTAKDFSKAVVIVDQALPLQEKSDEIAGVAQEAEFEPTLLSRWIHEVSIDVYIPDEWIEVETHSVAEPEASTPGIAPIFASETPPLGLVHVEPVNRSLTAEHEAPSAIGAIELEKQEALQVFEKGTEITELERQDRELISQPVGIEGPITGTEREMAFEERKSVDLPEQPLPDLVEWKSNPSNECGMTNQESQALPIHVTEASKNVVPISTQDEDIGGREPLSLTNGEADESMVWESAPIQVERINVTESSPCASESPVLADVKLTCQRIADVDSNQDERHARSTARVLSFADWGRVTEADARMTDAMVEEQESTSAPPKPSEDIEDIGEQVEGIWSVKNLKKRPLIVEPRTATEQATRPVKPKAPKVVGLSWPPTPLTDDAASPGRRVAESVGATDTIVAEPKEELPESGNSQDIDGAEADIQAPKPQSLWSLKYLKTRPVMVGPRTVVHEALKPVKLKAPKVVGLSWPPAPLTTAPGINGVFT